MAISMKKCSKKATNFNLCDLVLHMYLCAALPSTSTITVAASTVGYGGDHTMGVGGGEPGTCNAHPYI